MTETSETSKSFYWKVFMAKISLSIWTCSIFKAYRDLPKATRDSVNRRHQWKCTVSNLFPHWHWKWELPEHQHHRIHVTSLPDFAEVAKRTKKEVCIAFNHTTQIWTLLPTSMWDASTFSFFPFSVRLSCFFVVRLWSKGSYELSVQAIVTASFLSALRLQWAST